MDGSAHGRKGIAVGPSNGVSIGLYSSFWQQLKAGVLRADVESYLKSLGLRNQDPAIASFLSSIEDESTGRIHLRDAIQRSGHRNNILVRACMGDLVMPDWEDLLQVIGELKSDVCSKANSGGRCVEDDFSVSVCTVDGQQFTLGDADKRFPATGTIKPLLYMLALRDVGRDEMHKWVGTEPTASLPTSFDLLVPGGGHGGSDEAESTASSEESGSVATSKRSPRNPPSGASRAVVKHDLIEDEQEHPVTISQRHMGPAHEAERDAAAFFASPEKKEGSPKPYNPFMESGALVVASMVGRAHENNPLLRKFHDSGSRYNYLVQALQRMAGGARTDFNNPHFLSMKQKQLKKMAISHYLKGMGCYPGRSDPTDIAHLYFQACSIDLTTPQLAAMGATIASIGYCPLTDEHVAEPGEIRQLLSLMFSCGLSHYTGKWQFNVGIPACCGSSGALLIIIPNVMSVVIHDKYNPERQAVPPRALEFSRLLTKRYRINIFDQLVYQDNDIAIDQSAATDAEAGRTVSQSAHFFDLCTAAGAGDAATVARLIEEGADVHMVDYDYRSALHIACCEQRTEVVRLLLDNGHPVNVKDRWGRTPIDEAAKCEDEDAAVEMLRLIIRQLRMEGDLAGAAAVEQRMIGRV